MNKVESFELDHRKVKAPYVRKCCLLEGPKGDKVTKFDLRFLQPNKEAFGTAAMHGLEHLLAHILRDKLQGIIDISPMGCRTGFYVIFAGDLKSEDILPVLNEAAKFVLGYEGEIPGYSPRDCGNYLDMNLPMARYVAKKYYEEVLCGISEERMVYPE